MLSAVRVALGGPYAAAGYAKGVDTVYAGAAAIKGRDPSGVEIEAASVSVQVGAQNEAQATGLRLGFSNAKGSVSVEAATANAHAGFANPDGSVGRNGGAQAALIYGEGTVSRRLWRAHRRDDALGRAGDRGGGRDGGVGRGLGTSAEPSGCWSAYAGHCPRACGAGHGAPARDAAPALRPAHLGFEGGAAEGTRPR